MFSSTPPSRDSSIVSLTMTEVEVTSAVYPPMGGMSASGGLDDLYGQKLVGWAVSNETDFGPLVLDVCIDGVPVFRTTADKPRPDLTGTASGVRRCGLEAKLPENLFDGMKHTITLRTAASGAVVEGAELVVTMNSEGIYAERKEAVEGHVDAIRGLFVTGWAFDPERPNVPVEVELVEGGKAIARAVANNFRPDLLKLGKGTGECAFGLRLPPGLFDKRRHMLEVREKATGTVLLGAHIEMPEMTVSGHIEGLDGAAVGGWALIDGYDGAIPVELWIDGDLASTGVANTSRQGQHGMRFVLGIPSKYLDGRPHELMVCLSHNPGRMVAVEAMILPAWLTPEDALQRYAGTRHLRSYISPLGPQRYESLRSGLAMLAEAADTATTPEALNAIRQAVINLSHGQEQVIRSFVAPLQRFEHIEFAVHQSPDISIVIPVHNKFATTYNCLASIAAAQNKATYEVVVVDDGSKDETLQLASIAPNVTIVRHDVAQGFVGACNDGGLATKGKYILMLNNDTEVMSGWLDALLDPFLRFEGVGMTGAKLIYPTGALQEAGGLVWGDGQPWNIGRNANASDPRYNYVRQVDYLSGACVLLPMPLWRELGGFDTHFAPAYYEDTDLAFRVRDKGFKTVYTPFCEVVHYEGVSNGTSTSGSGLKRFQAINAPKFKSRWARAFRHNGIVGRDAPHVMQDRGTQFRALVLDAQTLTPDLDAGSYSATQEIRILQSLGFKVTFVPANVAYMASYTESLQRMGVEVLYAPFYFSMAEVIEKRGGEFDLFYIARYGVAAQVIDQIRNRYPQARVILNIHDLHFLRELREALQNKDANMVGRAVATREAELSILRRVDLALSYSEVEQAVIQSHNLDSTRTATCPWVVETAKDVPGYDARNGIAFLGGFGHKPNVEAVEWFVNEVMPLLRKKLPGVPFYIYGSKAPDSLKALVANDVVLKGYAKTTEEVYDSARIFVAPLLTGAGLKGKVIGAFSRGIPTVMTPTAAEGTGANNGHDAMVCTTPMDWANQIEALYNNKARWTAMSQACRVLTETRYSFENGRTQLAEALHAVGLFTAVSQQSLWPTKIDA